MIELKICGYCNLPIEKENSTQGYNHFFHKKEQCFSNYTCVLSIFNWVKEHPYYRHPDFKELDLNQITIEEFLLLYIDEQKKPMPKKKEEVIVSDFV